MFGDASLREEFATSNSKVFARLERGASYGMWGDLVGDLPSSDRDGGRWSSYQRHLTGVEVRLADTKGDHVTLRGAQPETAYAREVFAGGAARAGSRSATSRCCKEPRLSRSKCAIAACRIGGDRARRARARRR